MQIHSLKHRKQLTYDFGFLAYDRKAAGTSAASSTALESPGSNLWEGSLFHQMRSLGYVFS